jgi:hypothetical protein
MLKGKWETFLFGGQWKVPSLVPLGMFYVWLPLEGEGETLFFTSFYFSPQKILLKFVFHYF